VFFFLSFFVFCPHGKVPAGFNLYQLCIISVVHVQGPAGVSFFIAHTSTTISHF
jgi:hypothetical protein